MRRTLRGLLSVLALVAVVALTFSVPTVAVAIVKQAFTGSVMVHGPPPLTASFATLDFVLAETTSKANTIGPDSAVGASPGNVIVVNATHVAEEVIQHLQGGVIDTAFARSSTTVDIVASPPASPEVLANVVDIAVDRKAINRPADSRWRGMKEGWSDLILLHSDIGASADGITDTLGWEAVRAPA